MNEIHQQARVGLVLGGGGVRGLAHIGVLKVLEEQRVRVDFLAGTSMGGVLAAAYAAGNSPAEMEKESLRVTRPIQFIRLLDLALPWRSLFKGKRLRQYFHMLIGYAQTFADLRIPVRLVSADLDRGEQVILEEGALGAALSATSAVPGVFPPVVLNDRRLVDGAFLNNVPADQVRAMGADVVIAVDINVDPDDPGLWDKKFGSSLMPKLLPPFTLNAYRSFWVMIQALTQANYQRAQPEIIIKPQFSNGTAVFFGFRHAAQVISAGEKATREALPAIRACLNTFSHPD